MADTDDLPGRAASLLTVAIAALAEEIEEMAAVQAAPSGDDELAYQLTIVGDDFATLARAFAVLYRRSRAF